MSQKQNESAQSFALVSVPETDIKFLTTYSAGMELARLMQEARLCGSEYVSGEGYRPKFRTSRNPWEGITVTIMTAEQVKNLEVQHLLDNP